MDLTRVRAFAAVLAAKDRDAVLAQRAEGGVLNTPLAAEPVRGTAAIRPVRERCWRRPSSGAGPIWPAAIPSC